MTPQAPLDALDHAAAWGAEGRAVALATVIETWGSSPFPAGSQLAVDDQGRFFGAVSGGCIEGAVVREALEVIAAGGTRQIEYGVSDEQAWEVGLPCGGRIRLFIEAPVHRGGGMKPALLDRLAAARAARRPVVLITELDNGRQVLWPEDPHPRHDLAEKALTHDRSFASDGLFFHAFNPPLRLILVGAVHIVHSLAPIAAGLGHAVTIVDPRSAYLTAERFPGFDLMADWPDEALERIGLDQRSAVVVFSHDPKIDDPALTTALRSPAYYIGALGSRRNQEKRVERLRKAGLTEDELTRLHAPVGLDIGALSAGEIAVSVIAEMIAVRRGKGRR